ncbi:hypothetical protein CYMTET_14197 [Cymbomonas tetramitiformis]|uniref:Uncharacterized protein n=1 Tax=Cymbomonas tetramitiformis TaxID=36881 RepID=A0AAE0LAL9_9CHLO|nr:hypothetical protein CYMTET_14197 [Cymbomonas tetramitiformis]
MSTGNAATIYTEVAPTVDPCARWVKEANLQSAEEMLDFGLSGGKFTATTLVGEVEFKIPEVPQQQSASANRGSDRRVGTDNEENAEEEEEEAPEEEFSADTEQKYVARIMKLAYDFDAQVMSGIWTDLEWIEDGRLDSWDPIWLGHRFQYEYAQREAQGLLEEKNRDTGHRNELGAGKARKDGIV